MNKHSKYRKLLADVKQQICRAEIGVTGVYQLMLETLDKADKEELAMKAELGAANAHIAVLKDKARWALVDLSGLLNDQKMNMDDGAYKFDGQNGYELDEALTKTPAQSLAGIQAKAILDMLEDHTLISVSDGGSSFMWVDVVVLYANQLGDNK